MAKIIYISKTGSLLFECDCEAIILIWCRNKKFYANTKWQHLWKIIQLTKNYWKLTYNNRHLLKQLHYTRIPNMTTRFYISSISLNTNGLNYLIKRHRLAGRINKGNPSISCLQEIHMNSQNKIQYERIENNHASQRKEIYICQTKQYLIKEG